MNKQYISRRLKAAEKALRTYEPDMSAELTREDAIDCISDIRHWCAHNGYSISDILRLSEMHFNEESR